jgi:Tol biopolymer transport system component
MAFSDLPDICDYSETPVDQEAFFDALQVVINELCGANPITLRQSSVPVQDDFETAWLAAAVGNVLPIPTSVEFLWYDTDRLQIGGVFRTVEDQASNVMVFGYTDADPDWNWTTRKVVFQRLLTGSLDTLVVTDMMANEETALTPSTGIRKEPAWNDAGTMIVFNTSEFGGNELAKMNVDGTGVVRLTNDAFNDSFPHWRGTRIVYETNEYGVTFEIAIMNDDGTGRTRLTTTGGGATSRLPQLSPDGTKICYLSGTGVNRTIYIMDSNGANQTPLSTVTGINTGIHGPTWSPDGEWIYFSNYRIRPDGSDEGVWYEAVDSYLVPNDSSEAARTWINRIGGSATEAQNVSVDSTGTVVVSSLSGPITMRSVAPDGFESTGKVYQVSQYVDPAGNVRLLQQDDLTGTTAGVSLSGLAIPSDIEHILIIVEAVGATSAVLNQAFLKFNGDSAAANYHTLYFRAAGAGLTRNEIAPGTSGGIIIPFPGNQLAGQSTCNYMIWIPAIQSNDNVKQAIFEGAAVAGTVATSTNYNTISGVGVRNSLDPINQIELTLAGALGNFVSGSKISWYGFPGTPRWDKE